MPKVVLAPTIRGFISTSAHPLGCAKNVQDQVEAAKERLPGCGIGSALVVGSSTGYGLSSLISAAFGCSAKVLSMCLERPPAGERTASAGWYNLAEVHRLAKQEGRLVETLVDDAFSTAAKQKAIAAIAERYGKLDLFVYSLASPRRTDPTTGTIYSSVLKPIDVPFLTKTINLDNGAVTTAVIKPASEKEIRATTKVMGGEDWAYWVEALRDADLLAPGFRTVAYSYIGPRMTYPVYRAGTIGRAKDHLEATAHRLDADLKACCGGNAWVSVNKALVTQASAAIPVVPLYISLLYKVMKARGNHEDTIHQILRLFRYHLGPGKHPELDEQGRIRIDDQELDDGVQTEVARLWEAVSTENLAETSDFAGFRRNFRQLFGYEVEGVDYSQPVETEIALG